MYEMNLITFADLKFSMKRKTPRPIELQVFNFEQNYDWNNVWYDSIQVTDDTIFLVGPPLYEFDNYVKQNMVFMQDETTVCSHRIVNLDRVTYIIITLGKPMRINRIGYLYEGKLIPINVTQQDTRFNDKKVIVTISKNHPISWLRQWIDYHKVIHNLDGVILYNNQSTVYTSKELEESLSRPDMDILVVDYNVPFGCMGGGDWEWEGKSGTYLPWDSDFSQYIMLEHAKWKFLYSAKLVINADTDELLILKTNTLDDIAKNCETHNSAWRYYGTWIEPIDSVTKTIAKDINFNSRYFKNYWHTANNQHRGRSIKWMLNPKRNISQQWHLHNINGPHMETDDISFGHFLPMNTSWSYTRDEFNGDISTLVEHKDLKLSLNKWKGK